MSGVKTGKLLKTATKSIENFAKYHICTGLMILRSNYRSRALKTHSVLRAAHQF